MEIRISQLNSSVAARDSVVPVSNSSGTETTKTTIGEIVDLAKDKQYNLGNSGSAVTISSANGNVQTVTLNNNCTFTMPSVAQAGNLSLIITQSASFSAVFTGVKWPNGVVPAITSGAGSKDIINFVSDGTNWYGCAVQNLS
jgi:hypothetical protein